MPAEATTQQGAAAPAAAAQHPCGREKGARYAESRRRRKDELRSDRDRQAERTVQNLIFTLDRIPAGAEFDEWRGEVNRTIHRIRKSAKRTPDRDAAAVTAAMRKPLVQEAGDIALESGLPRKDVEQILSAMLATGAVTRRAREAPSITRGRPTWLYFLSLRPLDRGRPAVKPPPPAPALEPPGPEARRPRRETVSIRRLGDGMLLQIELRKLAERFPSLASRYLQPSIDKIETEVIKGSRRGARDKVLLALEQGALTVADLCEETGLSEWTVRDVLAEFERLGLTEQREQRLGEVGRPSIIHSLVHTRA